MTSQSARITAVLGLASIWLWTHRYFGIQHDGLFYAVQALARITPEAYAGDVFFAFGSQDDYSLFSRLYATLIRSLGLAGSALILLVAAQLAWVLAAAAVARQWLAGRAFWFGLALLFALPGHYGSQAESAHDVLRYAETFLTARSWAEPLVLAAIAAALARRQNLAVAMITLATLCHPIMALPGLIFLAAYYLRPGFRSLFALALLATAAAFVLLPEMDALWLAEVRRRARFVMLDGCSHFSEFGT